MSVKSGFQRELSETCKQAARECQSIARIFDGFSARYMSRLSRQELDLLNIISERFERMVADFHILATFAKYTEEV